MSELGEHDNTAPTAPLTLLDSEPGAFAVFSYGDVSFVCWPTQATGSSVRRLAKATEDFVRACPRGCSNIHVAREGAGLPTPEARAGFVEMMHRYTDDLACIGVVLMGSGFWASALQSAIIGMRMLAARPFPMRIENNMASVAKWLPPIHQKRTGTSLDPTKLEEALKDAYSRVLRDAGLGVVPGNGRADEPRASGRR